jgi:hypothetical protein
MLGTQLFKVLGVLLRLAKRFTLVHSDICIVITCQKLQPNLAFGFVNGPKTNCNL